MEQKAANQPPFFMKQNKNTRLSKLLLTICAISFSTIAIYLPGIDGPFIFDDLSNITNNTFLRITEINTSSITHSLNSGHAGPLKRPVAMLSFALNYYFAGGYIASAFKITNIVIHCINALLVFTLFALLFKQINSPHLKKYFGGVASSTALIWAIHPINLTSVLYVVQRMTSLSTLFSLASIILYLLARNRSLQKTLCWRTPCLFFASFSSLILALFSKENAALIPLIILLIELTLYSGSKPWCNFIKQTKASQITLLILTAIIAIFSLLWAVDYAQPGFNSRPFTMMERLLTEARVLCFYLSLILVPRIDGFGLFHDDIALSSSLLEPFTTITSIIFITGLLATSLYYREKNPLFSLGIGWFFIGHLLESTFFPLEIAHEHRNNLPSIGILLALASLIPASTLNSKKILTSLLFISLILGSTTWLRSKQWGNYQSLAYYEAAHHPNSPATQALLSNAANQAGDIEVATQAIKRAMELEPKETAYAMHYQNILAIYAKPIPIELQQETLRRLKANRLTPSTQLALDQIVGCLKRKPCASLKNNYLEWINAVIEKEPNKAIYLYMRGRAYRAINNELAALNDYQKAHEVSPTFLHPLFEIANILLKAGQIDRAEEIILLIDSANKKATFRRDKEIKKLRELLSRIK